MATIITAVEPVDAIKGFKVFLAGAIDMGSAVDWQSEVIEILSRHENIVLMNPRRTNFNTDTLDEQIHWELNALEIADAIIMWFPKAAKAPISFFESGLYLHSGKLVIGAQMGFYRRRNLEITCERYSVDLSPTIQFLCLEISRRYNAYVSSEVNIGT